jgi:hypothetical protein
MRFVDSDGLTGFGMAVIIVVSVLTVIALAMWADSVGCHNRWQLSGHPAQWGPFMGCVVNIDGKWAPQPVYRDVEVRGFGGKP